MMTTAAPAMPGGQNSEALQKVVLAGMKLMYDAKIFPTFAQALEQDPSPMGIAAQAAGLMKMLQDKAGGKIPRNIMIPAAVALLFEMAGFMVQAGMPKPSDADMQGALKALVQMMVKVFGQAPAQAGPAGAPVAATSAIPAAAPSPAPQTGLIGG